MKRVDLRQRIGAYSGDKRAFSSIAGGNAAASQRKTGIEEKCNSEKIFHILP